MSAGTYNITIDQGTDFVLDLAVKENNSAFDLTGYSARAQLRRTKNSDSATATFTCTVVSAAAGTIKMELSNSTTASITEGSYFYDLEIYTASDAIVERIIQGRALVTREITR
jgi:hypothetical protein